jgi:hypothetical protein
MFGIGSTAHKTTGALTTQSLTLLYVGVRSLPHNTSQACLFYVGVGTKAHKTYRSADHPEPEPEHVSIIIIIIIINMTHLVGGCTSEAHDSDVVHLASRLHGC